MLRSIQTGIVREVIDLDTVSSTNTFALDSGKVGLLVTASEQVAGKGRMGRSWFSPKGSNIYMTITVGGSDSRLPLVAGVAIHETVLSLTRGAVPVGIKWPNDILAGGKKICGILCESRKITAIGVGINVNQKYWPPDLEGRATSLSLVIGEDLDKQDVLERSVINMDRWYSLFSEQGFGPVREAFLRYGRLRDHEITTEEGTPCRITDLDMQGHLLIDISGSTRELVSGPIIVKPGKPS